MTPQKYEVEKKRLLDGLPKEFREVVTQWAWSRGHADGFLEVIYSLEALIEDLTPAIKAYKDSLTKKPTRYPDLH